MTRFHKIGFPAIAALSAILVVQARSDPQPSPTGSLATDGALMVAICLVAFLLFRDAYKLIVYGGIGVIVLHVLGVFG